MIAVKINKKEIHNRDASYSEKEKSMLLHKSWGSVLTDHILVQFKVSENHEEKTLSDRPSFSICS